MKINIIVASELISRLIVAALLVILHLYIQRNVYMSHHKEIQLVTHCLHRSSLTWVVLCQAGQGLCRVHTNIILGEDDLAVQARAQRRAPRPGVKGQEVGGLGGGTPQEPTQRHLLRRRDAGPILGAEKGRP